MRLVLVPSCLLGLGLLTATIVTLLVARSRIDAEIASNADLCGLVIRYALGDLRKSDDPSEALEKLLQDLAKLRHVSVAYVTEGVRDPPAAEARPTWLGFFEPPRDVASYPVTVEGAPRGRLVVATRPSDELAEIWANLGFLAALLAAIAVATAAAILLTARQTEKPLATLVEGLRRLRLGRFDSLGEIELVELAEIAARFDELAASLARSRGENRLLVDRLLAIQDSERKALARELHDQLGAALFGIRVAASCIVADTTTDRDDGATSRTLAHAQKISTLAEELQQLSSRMLERVRPHVVQRLGLCEALRDLVAEWRATHRSIACDLVLPASAPPVDEDIGATIYRIVQEALTNVARHSRARNVLVRVGFDRAVASVKIVDDGIGLPANLERGFGFLGMNERIRGIGGSLEIGNGPRQGTVIEASVPLAEGDVTAQERVPGIRADPKGHEP
jgi:two-component system sensor histidine kinase UhpB